MRGLFDDLPTQPAPKPSQAPASPCPRPADGGYVCRVGGGAATLSDNDGFSWFCDQHAPKGFWPHERGCA
jgi:hypothetical protein